MSQPQTNAHWTETAKRIVRQVRFFTGIPTLGWSGSEQQLTFYTDSYLQLGAVMASLSTLAHKFHPLGDFQVAVNMADVDLDYLRTAENARLSSIFGERN